MANGPPRAFKEALLEEHVKPRPGEPSERARVDDRAVWLPRAAKAWQDGATRVLRKMELSGKWN